MVSPISFTTMTKKPNRKDAGPESTRAEERVEAIKAEMARALVQRNTLPKSASDDERAAAAARVERLQVEHHDAVQDVLAIKREQTAELERDHKEKKLRHKRLAASRQSSAHSSPHEESAASPGRAFVRPPMDRAAEEALMDAANEEDRLLERQRLDEEDQESTRELAQQRRIADRKRKKDEVAELREARHREKKESEAKAEAARVKLEKDARAEVRQNAALERAEEAKAEKHRRSAEREARQRAAHDAPSSGWFSEVLRQVKALFTGRR